MTNRTIWALHTAKTKINRQLFIYFSGILRYQVDFQSLDPMLDGFDDFNLDDY